MAQGPAQPGGPLAGEPAALRAGMAATRREITRKLGDLKRALRDEGSPKKGRTSMTAKKERASAGKKRSGAKKTGGGRTAATKAKRVIKDVLAGAAAGAVQGAAEAAVAGTGKAEKAERKPQHPDK